MILKNTVTDEETTWVNKKKKAKHQMVKSSPLPAESQLVSLSYIFMSWTIILELHKKHIEHLFELYSFTT